jgi:hypothetical protein
MPKLKLKFKLPKEEAEANFALKGGDYFVVIHNLDQRLRDITKYKTIRLMEARQLKNKSNLLSK